MSATAVQVSDQISSSDVSLTCPNVTATLKSISCSLIAIRGSYLTASVNYNSSNPSFSILNVPSNNNLRLFK